MQAVPQKKGLYVHFYLEFSQIATKIHEECRLNIDRLILHYTVAKVSLRLRVCIEQRRLSLSVLTKKLT